MAVSMVNDGPVLQLSARKLLMIGWILAALMVGFTILGAIVSPGDSQSRAILLLPDVKALEDYRQVARKWAGEMREIEKDLTEVLENNGDLFSQSGQAQQALHQAISLVRQVEEARVPPVSASWHEQMQAAALLQLEAARSVLRQVSLPGQSNLKVATSRLAEARKARIALEASDWWTDY